MSFRWLFILLAAALGAASCTPAPAVSAEGSGRVQLPESTTASTAPLTVEYRRVSLSQTCLGNQRVKVDPDGGLRASRNTEECASRSDPWSAPYPEQPTRVLDAGELRRLRSLAQPVFELQEWYGNPVAMDGFYELLEIGEGERRRVVQVRNAEPPPAFRDLSRYLLELSR